MDNSAAITTLKEAKEQTKAPLAQQAIQFVIDILSGAPHAKIKANEQVSENQGPFDILGNSYLISENLTGNLNLTAVKQ